MKATDKPTITPTITLISSSVLARASRLPPAFARLLVDDLCFLDTDANYPPLPEGAERSAPSRKSRTPVYTQT
jgi:hypothetical protein